MRKLLLAMFLAVVCTLGAGAFTVDGLTYIFYPDDPRGLVLTGAKSKSITTLTIPASVTCPDGVERQINFIASDAFNNYTSLREVTFKKGSCLLGESYQSDAFAGCPIEKYYIGTTICGAVINYNKEIEKNIVLNSTNDHVEIIITENIGMSNYRTFCIGDKLSQGRIDLTVTPNVSKLGVGLPKSQAINKLVIQDGENALDFHSSTLLNSVNISEAYIGRPLGSNKWGGANISKVVFGSSNTTIPSKFFAGHDCLTEAVLPERLETISSDAFMGTKLKTITIPSTVTYIASGAFRNIESLKTIYFADGDIEFRISVNGLKQSDVFAGCVLDSIYLGRVSSNYFANNINAKKVEFGSAYKTIPDQYFLNNKYIEEVTLPEGLEMIGVSSFEECSSLSSIKLPTSLKNIGKSAFKNSAIAELELPSGHEKIADYSFYGTKINELNIPASVTYVGEAAFGCISSLRKVIFADGDNKLNMYINGLGQSNVFLGCALDSVYWGRICSSYDKENINVKKLYLVLCSKRYRKIALMETNILRR